MSSSKIHKVAIHGVPRSGTSWLGAIFDSSEHVAYRNQPLFSYAFKSFLNEHSSRDQVERFFKQLLASRDEFVLQKQGKAQGAIPEFKKKGITHVVYKEARYHNIIANMLKQDPDVRVIGIVRNPKSVISSWFNAPKEFDKDQWDLIDQWRSADLKNQNKAEEFYGYDKWKEVTALFLELKAHYPERFYLIDYADLLYDTENNVKKLFAFCDLTYGEQTTQFLRDSSARDLSADAYSVYRAQQVDTKWQADLPKEIVSTIDQDLAGTELEVFLR